MQSAHDRRDFIKKGLLLGGAAGLLTAGLAPIAAAQTVGKAVRRPDRYADSYIFERKLFTWPGNKTLAVWVAPNVEVWNFDSPVGVGVSPNFGNIVPDIINYGWREYGMRVGLWRLADVLDAHRILPSALVAPVIWSRRASRQVSRSTPRCARRIPRPSRR